MSKPSTLDLEAATVGGIAVGPAGNSSGVPARQPEMDHDGSHAQKACWRPDHGRAATRPAGTLEPVAREVDVPVDNAVRVVEAPSWSTATTTRRRGSS